MHKTLIIPAAGEAPVIVDRDTPEPGPREVLIQIKAVALNPIDVVQRDTGKLVQHYPVSLGHDGAGIIVKTGAQVDKKALSPGTRVFAFVSGFFHDGDVRYSAFQEYALAEVESVVVLPDEMSFEQATLFPSSVITAYTGWWVAGIEATTTSKTPADKEAVLVLGGASSVGSMAVQTAKAMGYTVFATASKSNHTYVQELGADQVFDYKDSNVAKEIIAATKAAKLTLLTAYAATDGTLSTAIEVLQATRNGKPARIAHAPMLPEDAPKPEGIDVQFVRPDMSKSGSREKQYEQWFQLVSKHLRSGAIVPSPHMQIEKGGLAGIDAALDKLKAGVSATKIVMPL